MGQYWKVVFLDDADMPCYAMAPPFSKLMEHAYLEDSFVQQVERLLSPGGIFYKSRLVWTGDYSEMNGVNLYNASDNLDSMEISFHTNWSSEEFPQIVNHDTKEYVFKFANKTNGNFNVHPLPLLLAEGNGLGGGDYRGTNEAKVGLWARNRISMEAKAPDGYTNLTISFYE